VYPEERQREIQRLVRTRGRVDVASLSQELTVTAETIRRDLTILERAGMLRRVHGGAIPMERIGSEPAVATRDVALTAQDGVRAAEKERIAKQALAEVPEEGSIILDAGTTTARLAQALPTDRELTVVVNSAVLALMLGVRPNLNVLLLGGRIRGTTLATADDWALRQLVDMYVDVAFLGTRGCSVERGLTTPDVVEAAVKRAMIAAARRSVLLADHTKIGNDYLARFGTLADLDLLITDTGLEDDLLSDVEAAGVPVVRA
jgi:DeoR family fructose operon transcriptional repressor